MSNQTNQNIYPKSCSYGCNTQIYWNTSVNEYWEVFTKKKHICPNRLAINQQQLRQIQQQQQHPIGQLIITNLRNNNSQNQKCLIPSSC